MKKEVEVIKSKENVLIKTQDGEYHFSLEEYKELGKAKAIKFAEEEIAKKNSSSYSNATIDFKQARDLGFCEYGIKDFCEKLDIDVKGTYKIDELNRKLTLDILNAYPAECLKVFGKDCIKYLGTVKELINENNLSLFLREEFIPARTLHELSVKFAYSCLHKFEDQYPDDKRPRRAIEVKEEWIAEKVKLGLL